MESSNVVINDEVCPEAHPESTTQVQDKPMEINDSLPDDYVVKHSDEELMVLNDAISMPSSPEPSTPVHETQQVQHEFSPSSEQRDEMKAMFEMIVGELTYFLGLQMKQTDSGIYINQAKYAKNLVKRFGLDHVAHARTPMAANAKLTNDPSGESVDVTLYRSMIRCLLYLTASRPDIAFSVGVCSRFQSNPKVSHLNVVKRIIKYVAETCDYGLFYNKESNQSLAGFSDSDWAGNADDRKSTTGGCFYVGANLVAWMSKKQNSVSLSTAEAEYIAARNYEISQDTMGVYCDNSSAIDISKNPV
ncbi:uncharacterized protein LOC115969350 [Quercus lobata]|uniref:uncharacterized protein LOC115969350 n=1 Tax=Quercus lobata TaxID=97700 RepID=UPI00124888A2|nr:uncharacterized protein LOC115969350 [Quercus lobata]